MRNIQTCLKGSQTATTNRGLNTPKSAVVRVHTQERGCRGYAASVPSVSVRRAHETPLIGINIDQWEGHMATDNMSKEQTPTEYMILKREGENWSEVADIGARSRNEAIKHGTVQNGKQMTGDFKAVPLRSWELTVSITTETKPVVNFSESKNGSGASKASPVLAG
jgi:hypothetical protein